MAGKGKHEQSLSSGFPFDDIPELPARFILSLIDMPSLCLYADWLSSV